jgi:hypothetical protein
MLNQFNMTRYSTKIHSPEVVFAGSAVFLLIVLLFWFGTASLSFARVGLESI